NIQELSAKDQYSKQSRGFWGPYLGPESALGLVQWTNSGPQPGENLDETAVRTGLGEILGLAKRDAISVRELCDMNHLCLCQAANAPDGQMLRSALLPPADTVRSMFAEDRRSQTLRLLLRLLEIVEGDVLSSSDLPALLNFDHRVADDPFV